FHLGESFNFLAHFIENKSLSNSLTESLIIHYKKHVRSSKNLYKKLVYSLMGKLESEEDFSSILSTTEDFLWFSIYQVKRDLTNHTNSSENISSNESLLLLQKIIVKDYGEAYFSNEDAQPLSYFLVLLLSLQFELALEYLSRCNGSKMLFHAVHIAICLAESKNLDIFCDSLSKTISNNDAQQPSLNLAKLICRYTKSFELTDPSAAFEYFFSMRCHSIGVQNSDHGISSESSSAFMFNVSRVVLLTRDFSRMFGSEPSDPRLEYTSGGVLKRFKECGDNFEIKYFIDQAAQQCELQGDILDSISLYVLCRKYSKAVFLCAENLAQFLAKSDFLSALPSTFVDAIAQQSYQIIEKYRKSEIGTNEVGIIDNKLLSCLETLLIAYQIFEKVTEKKLEVAFGFINECSEILPQNSKVEEVNRALKVYTNCHKLLKVSIPHIILMFSQIIKELKTKEGYSDKKYGYTLTNVSDGLLNYLGQLPCQISSSLCSDI
ncbi:MAG: Nucleoporin nup93, partial [Paramarteilia canceri]